MDNYILLFLAILENLDLLTKDEAKKLAKEYTSSGIPSNYDACVVMVKRIHDEVGVKPFSKKVDLTSFEAKLLLDKEALDKRVDKVELTVEDANNLFSELRNIEASVKANTLTP